MARVEASAGFLDGPQAQGMRRAICAILESPVRQDKACWPMNGLLQHLQRTFGHHILSIAEQHAGMDGPDAFPDPHPEPLQFRQRYRWQMAPPTRKLTFETRKLE